MTTFGGRSNVPSAKYIPYLYDRIKSIVQGFTNNSVLSSDKDNVLIPTDEDGNNEVFTGSGVTFKVSYGGINQTSNWTIDVLSETNVTTSQVDNTISVTSITGDEGSYVVRAIRTDYTTITKTISVYKSKQGITGVQGPQGQSFTWIGGFSSFPFGNSAYDVYLNTTNNSLNLITDPLGTEATILFGVRWRGNSASNPSAPSINDIYYNTTDYTVYIYNGSTWQTFSETRFMTWLGSSATAPVSPNILEAYYNSTDKKSYIWDGTSWEIIAQDGGATVDISSIDNETIILNGTNKLKVSDFTYYNTAQLADCLAIKGTITDIGSSSEVSTDSIVICGDSNISGANNCVVIGDSDVSPTLGVGVWNKSIFGPNVLAKWSGAESSVDNAVVLGNGSGYIMSDTVSLGTDPQNEMPKSTTISFDKTGSIGLGMTVNDIYFMQVNDSVAPAGGTATLSIDFSSVLSVQTDLSDYAKIEVDILGFCDFSGTPTMFKESRNLVLFQGSKVVDETLTNQNYTTGSLSTSVVTTAASTTGSDKIYVITVAVPATADYSHWIANYKIHIIKGS